MLEHTQDESVNEEPDENDQDGSSAEENEQNSNPGDEGDHDEESEDELVDADGQTEDEQDDTIKLSGMYQEWFLDYASYVILERAVPAMGDGLKPVQRRILHSLKEMDDGRYNKVANIIGNTMKYHPHGDASIGDALVALGQKDLLIDCQGNWGNTLTGDRAAAARYIEARLTKFANEVVFNPKTTTWHASYDGRNKEPVNLPIKFPLLLAQGTEGIAVGLACKFLPHNFIELIDGCIDVLRGKRTNIQPDFPNGGMADFTNYNDGLRGGKVRVRARISKVDKKTLMITEVPYGCTTTSLIESVLKANDKGKIKIKKIEDNTAAIAEIIVYLASDVSPDKMIDALYAFTDCEVSISPNSTVIADDTPRFVGVNELLRVSANHTVDLLQLELEIKKAELQEKWHFASLEKIFIENRIYRDIEEEETWEGVVAAIDRGIHKYVSTPGRKSTSKGVLKLSRDVTEDDIVRLTEIKIKRISKFDTTKHDLYINSLEEQLGEVQNHLDNIIQYAVDYFKMLKDKFGEGRERKTEIRQFDNISRAKVIVSNRKLYVNRDEGFIGWTLKKDEFIADCSEIDDVICFFEDGKMLVTKIADKKFVGKGIIHCAVWKKGDSRTIYHLIYQDGRGGGTYMKRFAVNSITRDKGYDLTKGNKGSKLHHFSHNPNGERETVTVHLRPRDHLRKVRFDIDFGALGIKGRAAAGNRVTKEIVSKVIFKEKGGSTLSAVKIWYDDTVRRLNDDSRGRLIGAFRGDDKILTVYQNGTYKLTHFNLAQRFEDGLVIIRKWDPELPLAAAYYDAGKGMYFVKRFLAEAPFDKPVSFISEAEGSQLSTVQDGTNPRIKIQYNKRLKETKHLPDKEMIINKFIDVKGVKAQGNQLTKLAVKEVITMPPLEDEIIDLEQKIIDDEARLKEQGQQQSLDLDSPAEETSGPAITNVEGATLPPPGPEAGTRYRKMKPSTPSPTGNEEAVGSQDSEKPVQFNFDDDDEEEKKED
jgi:topoisomerase-4 subunit A